MPTLWTHERSISGGEHDDAAPVPRQRLSPVRLGVGGVVMQDSKPGCHGRVLAVYLRNTSLSAWRVGTTGFPT